MPALRAEETLRERGASLPPKLVYKLMLEATGDKDAAEKAMTERIAEDLAAGRTPS